MSFNALEFTKELIRIPSVSAESRRAGDVARCAEHIVKKFCELGFDAVAEKTKLHPIVWAQRKAKNSDAKIRVLCYGHYDVQPVEPLEKWNTEPFDPVEKNGRLCGRGAADNKGPFMCLFGGLMKFLEKNPNAPIDIGIIYEGEEEISSPSMSEFIEKHKKELASYDVIFLSDTASAGEEQIIITTGLRGVFCFNVNIKGANTDAHSGMFGGAILNPIQAMAEIVASLHSKNGLVNIDGFYDGVLPIKDWERKDILNSPFGDAQIKESLGVEHLYFQEGVSPSEAIRLMPTVEFTGIGGGYQGLGNKSAIPSECFFKVSVRLVPNQDGRRVYELVKNAILSRAPKEVKVSVSEPDGIGDAYCVFPPNKEGAPTPYPEKLGKAFAAMEKSIEKNFGRKPLYLREGGSIPLFSHIKKELGLDCVMTGLFTPSDNLHAPNESFSLNIMRRAIDSYCDMFEEISK